MTTRSDIQIYTFEAGEAAHAIRVVLRDGDPWFVAADICRALDLGNASMALDRLDDDERSISSIEGTSSGGNPNVNVVSETGLYSLVLGSRKPEAKPFKRWITHEVLPAIARHGAYVDRTNRMGETLAGATGDAIGLDRPATAGDAHSLFAAVAALHTAVKAQTETFVSAVERMNRDSAYALRGMRQELSRSIGQAVRIAKAQRPPARFADPNRPLDQEEVERLKYLLSTGADPRHIARSLNRTHQVIGRWIADNQEVVSVCLQNSLW